MKAVTGEEFAAAYNQMAVEGMPPVASTIQAITDKDGTTDVFNVFIFYDMPELKKKINLDL